GSSTAGGAYVPAMSDQTVIVREQGTIFLGGPPLVKAATGEEVSAEELGGGRMHTEVSGVADHLSEDDEHARSALRDTVPTLPAPAPVLPRYASREPAVDPATMGAAEPADLSTPYDVHEVIARLVDAGELSEFKPGYGTTLVTGFARIHGHPVGLLAHTGELFSESAPKRGTHSK